MLNSLIQASALELSSFGVRVNGVAPGITNTEIRISDVFNKNDNKDYLDKMGDFFLLNKKVLEAKDIVHNILFLASDQSSFMTGEIMSVDNGYILNHDLSFMDNDN